MITVDSSECTHGQTLVYDRILIPVVESRHIDQPLFSDAKEFAEGISFLASNGPPNIVVVGHSVDSIYTAIAKLKPILDLSNTDWTLFLATTTNHADMLPRDEELSSSRQGI
jgi:hypothetical protein